MAGLQDINPTSIGLRTYDTAIGFRNVDERNATVTDFSSTHTIGMAAVLAGAIKGKDIIRNARVLKKIAADVLKINPYAFDKVVLELAELEIVRSIQYQGNEIISFAENVPLAYDDLHEKLGIRWLDTHQSELEEQFLTALNKLAQTPLLAQKLSSEIGIDPIANKKLRFIGENAELIKYYPLRDGTEIAVSPLHAFEHPNSIAILFEHHNADRVREAFDKVRTHPGFPILMDNSYPIVEDMVRLGLVPAPTVRGADHRERAFAVMLYGLDPAYLTSKKQILDRALALIACVRCGQISGGYTSITRPDALLSVLMNPNRNYTLGAHSSTPRQYAPLISMGMIKAISVIEDRWAARLVPTQDNLEAVRLAISLLKRKGEGEPERGDEKEAARLLFTDGDYLAPLETIALVQRKVPSMTPTETSDLWEQALIGGL